MNFHFLPQKDQNKRHDWVKVPQTGPGERAKRENLPRILLFKPFAAAAAPSPLALDSTPGLT
ncbi:MAG: hypothetical protein ABIS20_04380 [Thermoanaerobaculia bacterium]